MRRLHTVYVRYVLSHNVDTRYRSHYLKITALSHTVVNKQTQFQNSLYKTPHRCDNLTILNVLPVQQTNNLAFHSVETSLAMFQVIWTRRECRKRLNTWVTSSKWSQRLLTAEERPPEGAESFFFFFGRFRCQVAAFHVVPCPKVPQSWYSCQLQFTLLVNSEFFAFSSITLQKCHLPKLKKSWHIEHRWFPSSTKKYKCSFLVCALNSFGDLKSQGFI